MNSPTPPYEQQTQGRRKVECMSPSDGQREHADQAEGAEPRGGDNDQRLMPKDPRRACSAELEEKSDFQKLLIELEQERLGSSIIESAFYPAPLTVPARDAEWNAWQMLAWASPAGIAPFDEELASQGWYSAIFREHSDQGLAEIKEKPQSSELAAFKRLEELGVLTQNDFYSPSKAANGFYTRLLASQETTSGTHQPLGQRPSNDGMGRKEVMPRQVATGKRHRLNDKQGRNRGLPQTDQAERTDSPRGSTGGGAARGGELQTNDRTAGPKQRGFASSTEGSSSEASQDNTNSTPRLGGRRSRRNRF